jgi:hypothetical protein
VPDDSPDDHPETTAEPVSAEDAPAVEPAEAVDGDGSDSDPAAHQPLTRDDLSDDGSRTKARTALLLAAVLVVGIVIGRVTAPDEASDDDGGNSAEQATPDTIAFPSGDVNRTRYWGFANLDPVTIDTFDRPDSPESLGTAGTEQPWNVVSGTWGIEDATAVNGGGASDGQPSIATVAGARGGGLTEVLMSVVEPGAGLVFRYQDPDNYWSVTANPSIGSWTVTRVIDGEAEPQGDLVGATADGTTISVTQDGSTLRFLLEGSEQLSLTDGALQDRLQGGLIAPADTDGSARFDRFLVMRFRPEADTEG